VFRRLHQIHEAHDRLLEPLAQRRGTDRPAGVEPPQARRI
jgi:hypothetical protein